MNNPAVTELQRISTKHHEIWIEDNIGESICFHIDDIAIRFSVEQFMRFCDETKDIVNNLVNIKDFDINKIDPRYFEYMLAKTISHLKEIRYDEVMLEDMMIPAKSGRIIPLKESWHISLMNHYKDENNIPDNENLKNELERLSGLKSSIEENGYPYENQYIILYNDDNIIQDGHHRAACLYQLYGNVPVKVQRFVFDNYTTRSVERPFEFTVLGQITTIFKHPMAWIRKKKDFYSDAYLRFIKEKEMNKYLKEHGKDYLRSKEILGKR